MPDSVSPLAGSLFAADALLPTGWARQVLFEWNAAGQLTAVTPGSAPASTTPRAVGPVLPGVPNLHSHAFQRAFGGLTEFRGAAQDSFWSWRTLMYRFAGKISPAQVEAIATWLYVEMLEAGYTSVCEFHYLHHDVDGKPYADDAELALALLRAAKRTGIGLTLLPVLYQTSGFGGLAPSEGQRRFIRSTESMLRLLERLRPLCEAQGARLGLAPHSLRAVALEDLAWVAELRPEAPLHIHVAEQTREVEDSLAITGRRPVELLMQNVAVNQRWCLIHATHLDDAERDALALSGAVAGLCPITEANLGDGIFDGVRYRAKGGRIGVGSDSNVEIGAGGELRMLEYSQRLRDRRRALWARPGVSAGLGLWQDTCAGGAQACGRSIGAIAVGRRADLVTLDAGHPALLGKRGDVALDSAIFAAPALPVAQVLVGGKPVVSGGRHIDRARIAARYGRAIRNLLA